MAEEGSSQETWWFSKNVHKLVIGNAASFNFGMLLFLCCYQAEYPSRHVTVLWDALCPHWFLLKKGL